MTSLTASVPVTRDQQLDEPAPLAESPGRALRAVVVDDHPLYREGIVRALDAAGILVVAEADNGQAALDLIREHRPDVALLDVSMPLMDGIDVVEAVARGRLTVPVVLLSAFGDQALVLSGLQAGAATYISKTSDRDQIVQAVIDAADPSDAPCRLVWSGDLLPGKRHLWMPQLTLREYQLLQLAQSGLTKGEMATRMNLDEPAVRRGLSSATAKIGADTLAEALRIAIRAGVLR